MPRIRKSSTLLPFLFAVMSVLFFQCSKDVEPQPLEGTEYYPLKVGNYWIYDVVQHDYYGNYFFKGDTFLPSAEYSDTSIFQLKEELYAKDIDLEGDEYFELRRYKRADSNAVWNLDSLWKCKLKGNMLIRTENNINFVKLHFPVSLQKQWDYNAYNNINTDSISCDYSTYEKSVSYTYAGQEFPECVKVVHCSDSTALGNHTEIEYYAKDIGLIYKDFHKYDYCYSDTITCVNQEIIDNGTKYQWNLIEYFIQ